MPKLPSKHPLYAKNLRVGKVKWSHFFGQFCSFAKVYVV